MRNKRINLDNIHTIVFDFDGVFTDNFVYVDSNGVETIRCSRADSYGVTILKDFSTIKSLDYFVLSTESNPVVIKRCEKMGLDYHIGIANKWEYLRDWLRTNRPGISEPEMGVLYFGNDINDLEVISHVGYSLAPLDAHPKVKSLATQVLKSLGGQGFVREGIELYLSMNSHRNY